MEPIESREPHAPVRQSQLTRLGELRFGIHGRRRRISAFYQSIREGSRLDSAGAWLPRLPTPKRVIPDPATRKPAGGIGWAFDLLSSATGLRANASARLLQGKAKPPHRLKPLLPVAMTNRITQQLRSLLGFGVLLLLCSLSSCAIAAHAISTGADYPEAVATMDAPAPGTARVVVYTDARLADAVSIDRDVYQYRGRTFFTRDLPVGKHLVTASGISVTWGNPGLGDNRMNLELEEGETVFIAMRQSGGISEVERELAEAELANLPICTSAAVIDTISDEKWSKER